MILKERGCESANWIRLAEDKVQFVIPTNR
jgi:hypothetical protein